MDELDALDDMEADLEALDEMEADLAALDELDALRASTTGSAGGLEVRTLKGFLAAEGTSYIADRGGPLNDEQLRIEAQVELDLGLVGGLHLFVRPWFYLDTLDTELLRYEPLEGYLEYRAASWDLLVGQYIESWGIADTFNPLDVLNRRDFGPGVIDPVVRGELGARLRVQGKGDDIVGEPTLGFYAIPLFRPTDFPTEDNRFSFAGGGLPFDGDDGDEPKGEDALFSAVRFGHTLSAGLFSADMQYIVARGPERFPTFAARVGPMGPTALVPQYYGAWVAGGGFRAVPNAPWWSKLTLKAEVVYKRPYAFSQSVPEVLPEHYLQMVFGFDRLVAAPLSSRDQLTLTVEYLHEELAADAQADARPFDSDVVLRLFWEAGDFARTSVELRGLVDVSNGELILEGIVKRQLRFLYENLSLQVGGRYIRPTTTETSLFSRFPDNHSVDVRLQTDF